MKEEQKLALKIWGVVWTAIFVLSSFAFLLAQVATLFNYEIIGDIIILGIILLGSYYLILALVFIKKL